ncbi:MAG: plasmid replication protein, CyRepA1 family [Cyanobacteria bacterium J06623_1]
MLKEQHLQEWLDSAVDPELARLNVESLSGFEPYEKLLYALPDSERRNDGRLRDRWLKRYSQVEQGGWWVSGVDVLTGEESLWGQFKPDIPKTSTKEKGFGRPAKVKTIKYEAPPKASTEIIALKVTLPIWEAIASRYDVPLPEDITVTKEGRALGFWAWVIANPEVPIIITEGAKKAGSLLSAGYAAIALPGIFNGYRQEKDNYGNKIGLPYLIPQLKTFATKERGINFCFDNDIKTKTAENVRTAICKTGKLFAREGCRVSVINWNYPEKGVDDLIAARGKDCFEKVYKARIPLSKFNLIGLLDLSKYQPLKVDERYLGDNLIPLQDAQIIGLRSPKGTGKTEWLSYQTEQAISEGKPVLVIAHRIQLAKALCARFGIDHIEEIRSSETGGVLGYGLCIDSLHPNSQAYFNPEDWSEAIVIIDECEQVIWHMLDSSTCQDNRIAIIENFQQLLKVVIGTGGKIYLSDADLSCIAIDYVKKLINIPVSTWVVENVYCSSKKRKLISYSGSNPSELLAALTKAIARGEKVLIHTTGQKAKSKYGSINLESYLKQQFPDLKILRIDRDSVSEPNHPAYGCMNKLDAVLSNYDVVIASPVIETGVSIDLKDHFNSVWCIAQGVQTVDAVCQAVERLREDIPRHIWIKTTAKGNRIGNGSTSIRGLLASQHKLTTANIRLLQQAGINEFDELDTSFSPESLITWAKRACVVNAGKNNYRDEVKDKLLSEGYELAEPTDDDIEGSGEVKEQIEDTCNQKYQEYCQVIPQVQTPTDAELEELNNKKAKTQEERFKERKGNLIKRYGVEVTSELVEKDDDGWYPQLQLQYYLTLGNQYLAERDRRSLSRIKEQGNNRAFKPDINKKQLSAQVKTLQLIGIEQFLNPDTEFTKHSLAQWFEKIIPLRFDIQTVLGVSINPEKDTAIAVAQRILKKMGLSLEFQHQIRIDGKRVRVYRGCNLDPDQRSAVFDNWLKRDMSQGSVTPFSKEDIHTGGVTAA